MPDKIKRQGLSRRGNRETFTATVVGDAGGTAAIDIPITNSGSHAYTAGGDADGGADLSKFYSHLVIQTTGNLNWTVQINALSSSNADTNWLDAPSGLFNANDSQAGTISNAGILFMKLPSPGVAVRLKTSATGNGTNARVTVLLTNSSERSDKYRS
tara:strand:- start:2771 stop:3241 length:471 start_codon:yes stop_codon:yes gene_type:complete